MQAPLIHLPHWIISAADRKMNEIRSLVCNSQVPRLYRITFSIYSRQSVWHTGLEGSGCIAPKINGCLVKMLAVR